MKNHNDFDFHFSDVIEPEPSTNTIKSMENRYENEEALMECISRGDYEGAEQHFYQPAFLSDLEQRLPDTLRDQKNYLIIGNTPVPQSRPERKGASYLSGRPVQQDGGQD